MYRKELAYYFSTPIAYIVIGLYLLVVSLLLWVIPGEWNIIESGYSQVDGLFQLSPWLFMLLCPALTMRLFAEERQNGTWSILRSKPMPLWRIVTEKYLAAWSIVAIAQLPCLVHYFLVYNLAEPVGNIDSGAFFGSFVGLFFLSAAYCAIGCFSSSLTKSQIVAFIIGLLLCFVLTWGFDLIASMIHNGRGQLIVEQIGLNAHYTSISRGVIDLRDIVYFLSVSAVFLLAIIQTLRKK